jgi:SAM-dependent methyltransferase
LAQIERAKELGRRGLLCYQPFSFSDDYEVGVGWEFTESEYAGLIHWKDVPAAYMESADFRRLICAPEEAPAFRAANDRLRKTYDHFADAICARLGDVSSLTFADIGCNSGYLPLAFALRGAREAVGFDREDYGKTFALLNEILGTEAIFRRQAYDLEKRTVPGCGTFDVVTCMLVLCHLSDPMNFLSFLGRTARKALLLWNGVVQDGDLLVRFGQAGKYYKQEEFPNCFDYDTRPSTGLLRLSLELMGFTEIHQLGPPEGGLEMGHYIDKRPILAVRPDVPGNPLPQPESRFCGIDLRDCREPTLLGDFWNHNVVGFRGQIYGVPFGVPVDWSRPDLDARDDLFIADDAANLSDRILWDRPGRAREAA